MASWLETQREEVRGGVRKSGKVVEGDCLMEEQGMMTGSCGRLYIGSHYEEPEGGLTFPWLPQGTEAKRHRKG